MVGGSGEDDVMVRFVVVLVEDGLGEAVEVTNAGGFIV